MTGVIYFYLSTIYQILIITTTGITYLLYMQIELI